MKLPLFAFFAFSVLFFSQDAFAVPGPLVSGGIGILSNVGALLAVFAGLLAMSASFLSIRLRVWHAKSPKAFFLGASVVFLLVVTTLFFWYRQWSPAPKDGIDSIRSALAHRTLDADSSNVPFETLLQNLSVSPLASNVPENPALEAEMSFSIGRNNNVVWNRYLANGKVPLDEKTLANVRSGAYEIELLKLFSGAELSPSYEIVDLRTPLEYETSARFVGSENVEYRAVMNDEAAFDLQKTYVFVCHDGTADLSRSLIATAYLRSRGYSAYALRTGMRPILDRLGVRPARFSATMTFQLITEKTPLGSGEVFVDPLWALAQVLSEKKYPSTYAVFDFPFYRMSASEYAVKNRELESFFRDGKKIRFACYDTFSCFYARVFSETFSHDFPDSKVEIGIFR